MRLCEHRERLDTAFRTVLLSIDIPPACAHAGPATIFPLMVFDISPVLNINSGALQYVLDDLLVAERDFFIADELVVLVPFAGDDDYF